MIMGSELTYDCVESEIIFEELPNATGMVVSCGTNTNNNSNGLFQAGAKTTNSNTTTAPATRSSGANQEDVVHDRTKSRIEKSSTPSSSSNSEIYNNPTDPETLNYNHQCYICDKIFSANSNLNRHLRRIHKENVQSPYNNVKCALCESVYSSSSIYNQHLEKDHHVRIEIEQLTFADKNLFEEWKLGVENETTSQFIKSRGEKKSKDISKTYYSCNRSGYYVSKARTQKALKKQGSRKINGRCPASMNVTVNPDSSYDVRFVKTHVGHDFELKHLDLSDKDRDLIVQKLVSGTTKKDIIKQIRSVSADQPSTAAGGDASESPEVSSPSPTIQSISVSHSDSLSNSIEIIATAANEIVIPSTACTSPISNTANSNSVATIPPVVGTLTTNSISSGTVCGNSIESNSSNSKTCTPTTTNTNTTSNNITCSSSSSSSSNSSSQPTSRLHIATTKDIYNIINSKHLDSKLKAQIKAKMM